MRGTSSYQRLFYWFSLHSAASGGLLGVSVAMSRLLSVYCVCNGCCCSRLSAVCSAHVVFVVFVVAVFVVAVVVVVVVVVVVIIVAVAVVVVGFFFPSLGMHCHCNVFSVAVFLPGIGSEMK